MQTTTRRTHENEAELLLSEYRRQGRALMELVESLRCQIDQQEDLNGLATRYIDHVSHEFRTPLTVINDYLAVLLRGICGPLNKEQEFMLDSIAVHTAELNTMVEDILDVSRLEAGVILYRRRVVQPAEVVEGIRSVLSRKASVRKVSLEIVVDEGLPEIFCDPEKVGRALNNVSQNALKFCGDPGRVVIRIAADEERVRFSVKDNGPGIPPKDINRIFQRFGQRESDQKQSTRGFGLGLGIARELVNLSFGALMVESSPDDGSEFSITIPVARPDVILDAYRQHLVARERTAEIHAFAVEFLDQEEKLINLLTRCIGRDDILMPDGDGGWWLIVSGASPKSVIERVNAVVQHHRRRDSNEPPVTLRSLCRCSAESLSFPRILGKEVSNG